MNTLTKTKEQSGKEALEMVFNSLSGIRQYFENPNIQEIMINGPDDVWVEIDGAKQKLHIALPERDIISAIKILAGRAKKTVEEHTQSCILNERWPGARICAVLRPVALKGASMSIRKHSPVKYTLDEMRDKGVIDQNVNEVLKKIIRERKNILLVGGTSSGKTTFLKSLIREIDPNDRIITIEDLPELDIDSLNSVSWETQDELGISYTDLIKLGLRFAPDRFILGEIRDKAALDFLNAANTGHDGCLSTLHANSAFEGLSRFEDMVMQSGTSIPLTSIQRKMATTFHYVIFMGKVAGKRKLLELLKMEGFDSESKQYMTTEIFKEKRSYV